MSSLQPDNSVAHAVLTRLEAADTVLDSGSHLAVPDGSTARVVEITVPSVGDMPLIQLVRSISVLESVLIAVLFVLIAALVGVRVTDAISDREVSVPTQRSSEDDRRDPPPEDEPQAAAAPAYESVVSAETPPELLSDEGQVVRLLVENHGRIRQHEIADETGWSKSKVSRTLSKMHDNGTIEKTSLGRENVITLAEADANDPNQSDSDNVGNPVA
ncbi:helix-turn-helix transcriptional regulator [Halostagnicola kamekurae]|uniref:helix-turn-helix transcriptional regulator n=1 Tax=Halostagnicola kamekurae TaxID=619731 RepID=UPI001FE5F3E8|nr:helix-turn-helix domain-containing protein [Halostagnicola kamekurae]